MVKNMKTTLTEKINWTKYNLAYPDTHIDDPLKDAFAKLNLKCSNHDLVNNIISFIRLFKNGKHSPV